MWCISSCAAQCYFRTTLKYRVECTLILTRSCVFSAVYCSTRQEKRDNREESKVTSRIPPSKLVIKYPRGKWLAKIINDYTSWPRQYISGIALQFVMQNVIDYCLPVCMAEKPVAHILCWYYVWEVVEVLDNQKVPSTGADANTTRH